MKERRYYKTQNRRAFYEATHAIQNGKCAICQEETRLVVDHDHATGLMRGLLCYKHNMALGFFNDSPSMLRAAINYLEQNESKTIKDFKLSASSLIEYKFKEYDLIVTLLNDITFPSERAKAKVLAKKLGCKEATAQSKLRRIRLKQLKQTVNTTHQ